MSFVLSSLGRRYFVFCLSIVSIFPMLWLSNLGVIDPYTHNRIASSIQLQHQGKILAGSDILYAPASIALTSSLSILSGLDEQVFEFSLINGPIILIMFFLLISRLTRSNTIAALGICILSFGFLSPYYSIWPHGIGFTLFSTMIYLIYRYIIGVNNNRFGITIALILIVIAVHFFSYTTEAWMISLLFITASLIWVFRKKGAFKLANISSLAAAAVILAFYFNIVLFKAFIPSIESSSLIGAARGFFEQFFNPNFKSDLPYEYQPNSNRYLSYINLFYLILSSLPILIDVRHLFVIKSTNKRRFWSFFRIGVASILIVDLISYGLVGVIFFRYAIFIFPILSLWAISSNFGKFSAAVYGSAMASIAVFIFVSTINLGNTVESRTGYSEVRGAASWYISVKDARRTLIGDHHTLGNFDIEAARNDSRVPVSFYTPDIYSAVFDSSRSGSADIGIYSAAFDSARFGSADIGKFDFVVNLRIADKKTWTGGWKDLEPIRPFLNKTLTSGANSVLYNDGTVIIMRGQE